MSVIRPRQRKVDAKDRSIDPQTTLVHGLPLPGYRGLQFGLPASRMFRASGVECLPRRGLCRDRRTLGMVGGLRGRSSWMSRLSAASIPTTTVTPDTIAWDGSSAWSSATYVAFTIVLAGLSCRPLTYAIGCKTLGFNNVSFMGRGVDSRALWSASSLWRASARLGRSHIRPRDPVRRPASAGEESGSCRRSLPAMKQQRDSVKFVVVGDGPLRASLQSQHRDLIFRGIANRRAFGEALCLGRYVLCSQARPKPSAT